MIVAGEQIDDSCLEQCTRDSRDGTAPDQSSRVHLNHRAGTSPGCHLREGAAPIPLGMREHGHAAGAAEP